MNDSMKLMQDIITDMAISLNQTQLVMLQQTLTKRFNNYDIKESNNAKYQLVTKDEVNESLLKHYTAVKLTSGIAERTVKQYLRATKKLLISIDKRAIDITTEDIEYHLMRYKYEKGVSNTTLNNEQTFIRNFFNFLVDKDYIHKNPCDGLAKIKCDTIREKPFTKEEEESLYVACSNLRDRAIMEVLFATGCRVGELVNMKKRDVDFKNGMIDVVGKGNKARTVCVSEKALYHITRYLNARNATSEYLFVGNRKPFDRLTPSGVETMLKALEIKAGVDNVHPHRFRSSFCTRILDSGMNVHQVSKLMGHSSIDTTMIYYRGNYNLSSDYNRITNF